MIIKSSDLEKIAVKKNQYPSEEIFEFAFAGRSNVGKSSFINAMLGRKNLARTSSSPGKTRTVNFYRVNYTDNAKKENKFLRLVDLPGYGYAKVSKSEKDSWAGIINEYLESRENLIEVFLVVDLRHPPTGLDKQMYHYILESGFSGLVIATKKDKVGTSQVKKNLDIIAKDLKVPAKENIILFSSEKKDEVDDTWFILDDIVKFHSK